MGMHWLDLVIIGVISLSILTGVIRGFIKELIALCIWVLAIWMGYQYAPLLDPYLNSWISDKSIRFIAGFVIIMVSTLITGGIFNAVLGILMKKSGLSGTDRILGIVFGFARGFFIVTLGLLVLQMTSLSREEQTKDSRLMVMFQPSVQWISARVPSILAKMRTLDQEGQLTESMMPEQASHETEQTKNLHAML